MPWTHVIGPEEREWFRWCRRAWDFGSPNRRNLEPQTSSARIGLTRAVRMAMAVWYFPGMWEWPRAIVLPRAMQAFEEALSARGTRGVPPTAAAGAAKDSPVPKEAVESARAMLERYFAWAPTVDAFTPVRVEAEFEANVPDRRTPGHDLVDAEGRAVRYHDRVPVLIVDANDVYWVLEHRLTDEGWAERDELLLAERPVAAIWGWEQFYLNMEIAGTVHNELRLVEDGPAGGKPGEGRVARRPRSRDWARSRAAGRSAARPAETVVQEGGAWFRRTWIPRTRAEVNAVADHLFAEAVDMLDPALRLYPSPAPEHCGPCEYRAPCLAINEDSDVEAVLAQAYRPREGNGPEEGRLGGGTWSMSRGAAPPPQWRSR